LKFSDDFKRWWNYFDECNNLDFRSASISSEYCGAYSGAIPGSMSLQEKNGRYGLTNLYCSWRVDIPTDKSIEISLVNYSDNYFGNSVFVIEVLYQNGVTKYQTINFRVFDWNVSDDIKAVNFHFFTVRSYPLRPFELKVNLANSNGANINFTGIVISILSVLIVCIILLFIIIKCRNSLHAYRAQNSAININNIVISASQDEVRRKNQEILNKLFQTVLKPVKYTESLNKYGSACTICLDEFSQTSEVTSLECGHLFHHTCLKDWLNKNILSPKCPNCNNATLLNENMNMNNLHSPMIPVINSQMSPNVPGSYLRRRDNNEVEISHLNLAPNNINNFSSNVIGRIDININSIANHPQTISVELRNAGRPVSNNYVEISNQPQTVVNENITNNIAQS
jgi:hypothetical protein